MLITINLWIILVIVAFLATPAIVARILKSKLDCWNDWIGGYFCGLQWLIYVLMVWLIMAFAIIAWFLLAGWP